MITEVRLAPAPMCVTCGDLHNPSAAGTVWDWEKFARSKVVSTNQKGWLLRVMGSISGDRFAKRKIVYPRTNHLCIFHSAPPRDIFTFIRSGAQFGGKCFA